MALMVYCTVVRGFSVISCTKSMHCFIIIVIAAHDGQQYINYLWVIKMAC